MAQSAESRKRNTSSRQNILEAASKLFTESGYVGTTTLAIAREAGVNETTVFRIFGSKKALFQEIFSENTLGSEHVLLNGLTNGEDLKQDLKLMFKEYQGVCIKHIPTYRLSVQQVDKIFNQDFFYSIINHIDNMSIQMESYLNLLRTFGRVIDIDFKALSEFLFSVFLIKAPQFLVDEASPPEMEAMQECAADAYAEFVYELISIRE